MARPSDFNIENSFRCFIDQSTHSSFLIELSQGPSPLILWMTGYKTHPAAFLPSAPVPLLTFPVTLQVSLLVMCVVWVFTAPLEALIRSGWWGRGPVGSSFRCTDLVVLSQRLKVLLNFTFCSVLLRRSWLSSSNCSSNWGTYSRNEINRFTHWLKPQGFPNHGESARSPQTKFFKVSWVILVKMHQKGFSKYQVKVPTKGAIVRTKELSSFSNLTANRTS